MKKNIAVLSGDGIGPEIVQQAIKVLDAVANEYGHQFNFKFEDMGAIAIDRKGNPLPDETLATCKSADAILFGAIGDPKYDNDPTAKVRPEQGLLKLRKELGLFANIRPVHTYKELIDKSPIKAEILSGTDIIVFRELTSGIYFGEKGRKDNDTTAFDVCEYTSAEIDRIAEMAFESAMLRKKELTLIDKANVLETSRLWRERVKAVGKRFPEVTVSYMFVDNAAMQVMLNPTQFDVVVTENMFGDIITDQLSAITGSIGLMPSASAGGTVSLYEPIHGSYPQAAGKDIANPLATILSAAMMLRDFGLLDEANAVEQAVHHTIKEGVFTQDLDSERFISCSKMGDVISMMIEEREAKVSEYIFEGNTII